jgi:opacity protein-like surface antigen
MAAAVSLGNAIATTLFNGVSGLLTTAGFQPGLTTFVGSNTRDGWTAGIGGEYAFWTAGSQSATVFVEYDHYDFGTKTIGLTSTLRGNVQNFDIRERKDVVKAGLNWRFNFLQPAVARY